MLELGNTRQMFDDAERAARAGDFVSADELLRDIARIQEAELGALHPELANTLNNLAIVSERRGRLSDAEAFYSRSVMIASSTLPPEHPMVVTSRQNLEAFRRARAASTSAPATKAPAKAPDLDLNVPAREQVGSPAKPPAESRPAATAAAPPPAAAKVPPPAAAKAPPRTAAEAAPRAAAPPPPEPRRPAPPAPQPPPLRPPAPSLAARSGSWSWILIGVVALLTVGLLANGDYRNWLFREAEGLMRDASTLTSVPTPKPAEPESSPSEAPTAASATPPPPAPAAPPPAPAPAERTSSTPAVPPSDNREAPSATTSEITLSTVQLCRSLSTGSWRCDPAGDTVAEGPLVLYTRVRSPRGGALVHQWYHGDTVRKSVPLNVRANATEGYRTYSRLTVDEPGDWRVEVKTADGELLHEERFSVR